MLLHIHAGMNVVTPGSKTGNTSNGTKFLWQAWLAFHLYQLIDIVDK